MIARILRTDSPLLRDIGLLVLRLMFGLSMLIAHGWGKIERYDALKDSFADPFGFGPGPSVAMAIFAEVVCAGLVAVGLLTRFATIPLIITMLVAGFIAHGADPWKTKELAFVYLAVFTSLLLMGPGRFSVDALVFKK